MRFDFNFGEMTIFEREKLYNYVIKYNPNIILECGAGVGASTHIMINALNDDGKIYSCDPERKPNFVNDKLNFYNINSDLLIKYIIDNKFFPNFIFFDGPEDPNVALNDFKEIDKYLEIGTIFSMHDWCLSVRKYDNGFSTKAKLIKPYINSLDSWELLEEFSGEDYIAGEESVGLCFYKKINNNGFYSR